MHSQELPAHREMFALLILQHQHSIPDIRIKLSMPDEVKDVNILLAQSLPKSRQRCPLQSLEYYRLFPGQLLDRFGQFLPLGFDIKLNLIAGAGNHDQNTQRRLDPQRLNASWNLHVTHDRRIRRERQEAAEKRIVEIFPGQVCEFRYVL